jgi:tripartite-type tricarboxylate transporter receptor subunit TctC
MRAAKVIALIGLAAQLLLLGPSSAADYPSRPIKLLVGASAGGTTDTMARAIAEPLSNLFGKPRAPVRRLRLRQSHCISRMIRRVSS